MQRKTIKGDNIYKSEFGVDPKHVETCACGTRFYKFWSTSAKIMSECGPCDSKSSKKNEKNN